LNQSEVNFELLLINDGSTERREEIILSFSDSRIRYVKQINQGVAVTRNLAIDMAKGNFIVFQDADDVSVPSRFEILKRHFISDIVGLVQLRYFFKIGTPICGGTVMARREVFRNVRYDPALKIGEDNDVLSKITQVWDSIHVPEPLYLYRRHGNNSARETRYEAVFAHVQKLLEEYSLQELIPEINWNNGDYGNNQARALSIISLFLNRRGMYLHVETWRKATEDRASEADSKYFIEGITHMIEKDYAQALKAFQLCKVHDHIVENYKGECFALIRETQDAVHCFLKSLKVCPSYEEPIDNLKGLGGLSNFNMGDITWLKFR
jgi:glycosyltransferase involved in cell wall biosynthesis